MDPAMHGRFEAVPVQCFGCAERDAEQRRASEAVSNERLAKHALDGIYYAVQERR